jgi:hypothetical protein
MNKKGTEAGFFFFEERTEAGLHALYKRGQKKNTPIWYTHMPTFWAQINIFMP